MFNRRLSLIIKQPKSVNPEKKEHSQIANQKSTPNIAVLGRDVLPIEFEARVPQWLTVLHFQLRTILRGLWESKPKDDMLACFSKITICSPASKQKSLNISVRSMLLFLPHMIARTIGKQEACIRDNGFSSKFAFKLKTAKVKLQF